MDEITRLLKDLIKLLQTIAEEDNELLERMDLTEIKKELGPWFIAGYPLYQGS
jgi:hypothetical protein